MKLGALDYLEKPVSSPAAIRELVARALERRAKLAAPACAELPTSVKLTFGAKAMTPVIDALARVAKTQATVLLQGESGTGKEVASRRRALARSCSERRRRDRERDWHLSRLVGHPGSSPPWRLCAPRVLPREDRSLIATIGQSGPIDTAHLVADLENQAPIPESLQAEGVSDDIWNSLITNLKKVDGSLLAILLLKQIAEAQGPEYFAVASSEARRRQTRLRNRDVTEA